MGYMKMFWTSTVPSISESHPPTTTAMLTITVILNYATHPFLP
jgi:hypothetical protein